MGVVILANIPVVFRLHSAVNSRTILQKPGVTPLLQLRPLRQIIRISGTRGGAGTRTRRGRRTRTR